ncbi:MAG: hypothetical protein AAGC85_01010 [Bacteroidota bacterium]
MKVGSFGIRMEKRGIFDSPLEIARLFSQMKELFRQKYRVHSSRATFWNYGWQAAYFITICTKDQEHFFGEIQAGGNLRLSKIGNLVPEEWIKTPDIRPDMNLSLGEHIIMPNHFHGILIIGNNEFNGAGRDAMHRVSTSVGDQVLKNKFGPQSKKLASIIRGFKSAVTKKARRLDSNFGWQARFHDRVIRNEDEYNRISTYIINNPLNWEKDRFFL